MRIKFDHEATGIDESMGLNPSHRDFISKFLSNLISQQMPVSRIIEICLEELETDSMKIMAILLLGIYISEMESKLGSFKDGMEAVKAKMSKAEKDEVRAKLKEDGEDCSTCDNTECRLHPSHD